MPDESIIPILQRLDRMEKHLDAIDARIEALDNKFVTRDVIEARSMSQGERIGHLERDVSGLSDDKKWVMRIILGLVITSLIGLVLTDGVGLL